MISQRNTFQSSEFNPKRPELNVNTFRKQLVILKSILIVLTFIEAVIFLGYFIYPSLLHEIDDSYCLNGILKIAHSLVALIFLWFNHFRMPIDKKKRNNNIFAIVFLGVVGMWLFLPNEKELERLLISDSTGKIIDDTNSKDS